jgi:hypothetical protein
MLEVAESNVEKIETVASKNAEQKKSKASSVPS